MLNVGGIINGGLIDTVLYVNIARNSDPSIRYLSHNPCYIRIRPAEFGKRNNPLSVLSFLGITRWEIEVGQPAV